MLARTVRSVAASSLSRHIGKPSDAAISYGDTIKNGPSSQGSGPPTVMGGLGTLGARAQLALEKSKKDVAEAATERFGDASAATTALRLQAGAGVSPKDASAVYTRGAPVTSSGLNAFHAKGFLSIGAPRSDGMVSSAVAHPLKNPRKID